LAARGGQQPVGRCCRVWLPDAVLPAGERLRATLEGTDGSNFAHLRRKHRSTKFSVFGTASLALPPWKRLQVVALCVDQVTLEKVEADVLDLVETACDVVADSLGLSDEQVQQAFEDIRVERHDMKLPLVAPAAAPAAVTPELGLQAKVASPPPRPAMPLPLRPVGQSTANVAIDTRHSAGHAFVAVAPAPLATVVQQQAAPQTRPVTLPAVGRTPPPPPPPPQQAACAFPTPSTALAVPPPAALPPAASVAPGVLAVATAAPGGLVAATAAPPGVVAAAPQVLPATHVTQVPPSAQAGNTSSGLPRPNPAHQPMPPPLSTTSHKRKRGRTEDGESDAATPAPAQRVQSTRPQSVTGTIAKPDAQNGKMSDVALAAATLAERLASEARSTSSGSGSSSSGDEEDEIGPSTEEEEEEEDTNAEESRVASVETDAPAVPAKVQLFKLGQLCCSAIASFATGSRETGRLAKELHIDQRATLERCREHLEWAGGAAAIWQLTAAAGGGGRPAYRALCDYFVAKHRVGLVETPAYAVYIVPPAEKYFREIGLAASRHMVGLQVPVVATAAAG